MPGVSHLFANGSGIDFAGHAASLGAVSRKVASLAELERALPEAHAERRTSVIVIATEDTTGKGHLSQHVEGKIRHSIFVPVD